MATITNKTKQTLCITGEGWRYPLIPSGASAVILDDHARDWMDRAVALVSAGAVVVKLDGTVPEAPASDIEPVPQADPEPGFRGLHWRAAITQAESMTDLDALVELLEQETRPKVREAIEDRMASLQE